MVGIKQNVGKAGQSCTQCVTLPLTHWCNEILQTHVGLINWLIFNEIRSKQSTTWEDIIHGWDGGWLDTLRYFLFRWEKNY